MKHLALFSSKYESKKIKVLSVAILLGSVTIKLILPVSLICSLI